MTTDNFRIPTTLSRLSCLLALAVSLCTAASAYAQQLTVQAPSSVYVGDNFSVRFSVDDNAKNFQGPSFKGFSLLSGPNQSSSTSMSFVNGKMSRSVNTTFSYTLKADMEGTFTVGAASCTADGKRVESRPFTVKVEKPSQQVQQQRQQQAQQRQAYDPWAQQPQPATQIDENTLFARTSVSNTHPYVGEQVIVTYKIYTQIPISQFAIDKLPGNRGFWSEDLSSGQQVKQYEETVGGRQYQVAEIRRGALFAQQEGKLAIEPLSLNVLAMVQRQRQRTGSIWDLFDDPFFNSRQAVERALTTNRIGIQAKALPPAPDGFGGAVGRFDASATLSDPSVKANEAVTYRITVSGSGNLMLINAPAPQFPSSFEVYDPQIKDNIKKGDNGISGSRTYEWVLIPRTKGDYTIPEFSFVYFDPASGQYVSRQIPAMPLTVEKGSASGSPSASGKDDVQLLAEDINYLHPTGTLKPVGRESAAGWLFWTLAAAIALATAGTVVVGKRRQAAANDTATLRRKRATKMARKRLKKSASFLAAHDAPRFYEEIYRAIWGCIADKYNIPLAQLNRDSVVSELEKKQVPPTQQEQIMKVLQDVDVARFAPGDASQWMQSVYDEALEMIANL